MGRSFKLMDCYCYSGEDLIQAAIPGEYRGGGKSGGRPEKHAGLQTTAGRSRKQHSRTVCDLPDSLPWLGSTPPQCRISCCWLLF